MLHERPLWQANYKSMSVPQLVRALNHLAEFPHRYDNSIERQGVIGAELALRAPRIIIAETEVQKREKTMSLTIVDGPTIAQGESLSDGADISGGTIVRITVPQEFTNANLTFQSSSNGDLYNDLYDAHGQEVTMVAKPDTTIIVQAPWARTLGWIKLRSGTRGAPVLQNTTTKFGIAVEVSDAPV